MDLKKITDQIWSRKDYKKMFVIFAILSFILLIFLLNKAVFFVLAFILVNALLGFILLPFKEFLFGIDLTMLAAVLCGMAFGWKVGLLVGLLSSVTKLMAQQSFSIYGLIVVPSYVIIGIVSGIVGTTDVSIFTVGIIALIFHTFLTVFFSVFMLGGNFMKVALFLVTNVPMNLFLFYYFAPALLRIMTV